MKKEFLGNDVSRRTMKNLAALAFVPEQNVIQEFTQIKENAPEVLDGKQKKALYVNTHTLSKIFNFQNYSCILKTILSVEKCQEIAEAIHVSVYQCGTVFQELI